jgi:hypothetical protein
LVLEERGQNGFRSRWIAFHPTPVQAFIPDDGRYVVLRDRWGQVGYGKVLTFFGPDGRVLASYTLEQLLPFDEIWEVPITASSRWWGSNALFFFRQGQKQFAFVTERGR